MRRTVKSSSSEAQIVQKYEDFSKPTKIGDKQNILLCVGGENRAVHSNFYEKTASRCKALPRLYFVNRKLRQTPQTPPKKRNDEIRQNRQQRPGKVSINSLFYSKSNILFHRAILSFLIFNSIQMPFTELKFSTAQSVTKHSAL